MSDDSKHHHGAHDHAVPASLLESNQTLALHMLRPRNLGRIRQPHGLGTSERSCGDTLEVSLTVQGSHITAIRVLPRGCGMTVACASMATTLAEGKSLTEARRAVTPEAIDAGLEGLPKGEEHCARLAARAVRAAIDDAIATSREPWKRAYRA